MPADPRQPDSIAAAIAEISDSLSRIVQDEIALAKAEVGQKFSSLARGAVAVAAGAIFGVFAIIFGMSTLAWGLDAILVHGAGNLFLGFLIVFGVLTLLAAGSGWFAWRKLKVGAPVPTMAIDEAKKVQATVTTQGASRPGAGR